LTFTCRYGEIENKIKVAGFVRGGGSLRNKSSIEYLGFNQAGTTTLLIFTTFKWIIGKSN
jgi:hypothetical protein